MKNCWGIAYFKELKANTVENEIRLLEEQIEDMKTVIEKATENRMSILERNRIKRIRQNIKKMQVDKVELEKKVKRYLNHNYFINVILVWLLINIIYWLKHHKFTELKAHTKLSGLIYLY